MVRKTVVITGLFLATLAFVLDSTATTAEACGGCRGGCRRGCGNGCGYGGYSTSYYGGGSCGGCGYGGCGYGGCGYGGCGYGGRGYSSCGTACCYTPVYVAPTCCNYGYPGAYAPAYVSSPVRQQYYVSPALPVSTYGMPVAMPTGSVLRRAPMLVSYSR
jgi:hypothetical protein